MIEVPQHLKGRHLLRVSDFEPDELTAVLDLADTLKRVHAERGDERLLPGRSLGLIFEKPSARTRISFEVGIAELGGISVYLGPEFQFGRRESIRDTGHVLSRYLDAVMVRTFAQHDVDELAAASSIPIVNGLTDEEHPCQALADVMTVRERLGRIEGVQVVYVGDGNNVCASLMVACASLGASFVAATPEGYEPAAAVVDLARSRAAASGAEVRLTHDPSEGARNADVLYADVWTSMGQEEERQRRLVDFAGFTIDAGFVAAAPSSAIVLHCLPAHYGEEITEEVVYGPLSAVFDQAENRLHAQKALLALIVT
jgi:ornithine carbamoyltransferase